jgi:hypothetical protein
MLRILIIEFDSLANFGSGHANNRIGIRIVVGWPFEDFDAKDPFLKLVRLAC